MILHKKTGAIASALLLSTLISGAAFAKAVPPVGPNLGITATVTTITSHTITFKEKTLKSDKTVTLSTSQISHVFKGLQKSAKLSNITVGQRVMLQSTKNGWVITVQPTPPAAGTIGHIGTIEHMGTSTITVKIMGGPGQDATTKTISLSKSVTVQSASGQTQSLTTLKLGESIMMQTTSTGMIIHVMPTPPRILNKAPIKALKTPKVSNMPKAPNPQALKTPKASNMPKAPNPQALKTPKAPKPITLVK
jgi:hypothetical protein